jgi:hypothetical protein
MDREIAVLRREKKEENLENTFGAEEVAVLGQIHSVIYAPRPERRPRPDQTIGRVVVSPAPEVDALPEYRNRTWVL